MANAELKDMISIARKRLVDFRVNTQSEETSIHINALETIRMSLVKTRHSKISFQLACIYNSSIVDLCRRKSKISGKKCF